jgi:hypothetical protein
MNATLLLDGRKSGQRYLVEVNGTSRPLSYSTFKYLFKMALARLTTTDGWIYKTDLEPGRIQHKYIYWLRRELGDPALIENKKRHGCYRIAVEPPNILLDWTEIDRMADEEMRQMIFEYREMVRTAHETKGRV